MAASSSTRKSISRKKAVPSPSSSDDEPTPSPPRQKKVGPTPDPILASPPPDLVWLNRYDDRYFDAEAEADPSRKRGYRWPHSSFLGDPESFRLIQIPSLPLGPTDGSGLKLVKGDRLEELVPLYLQNWPVGDAWVLRPSPAWLASHRIGLWLVENVRGEHLALVCLSGSRVNFLLYHPNCFIGNRLQVIRELQRHATRQGLPYLELLPTPEFCIFTATGGEQVVGKVWLDGATPANGFGTLYMP